MKTKNHLKHAFKCDIYCGDFAEIMLLSDHVLSVHEGKKQYVKWKSSLNFSHLQSWLKFSSWKQKAIRCDVAGLMKNILWFHVHDKNKF